MVDILQAQAVNLRDLIDKFGIQLVEDEQFFREWQDDLPELTDLDKQLLDKVKAGYINLRNYPPLLENVIRMAVLDPMLFIGDFYLAPFYVKAEKSVEIIAEDEGTIIRGKIDTLILKDQFWVMVIESKKGHFSIEAGLAQILAYMLGNPHPDRPNYGLISAGGTFIFIKLVKAEGLLYSTSNIFGIRNRSNDLYTVLKIMKRLSQLSILPAEG
jgi:hypothetical protein